MPLTSRWTVLNHHEVQQHYWNSPHRFNVVPSGRRSGKSETAKRRLIRAAMRGPTRFDNARFFAAAPTNDQARSIYWADLKAMVPPWMIAKAPSEVRMTLWLINGSEIQVVGMDRPERIEGMPWDGGILDEYANMKEEAWPAHVRPALSDRKGWCDLIGVPEGRNHYYDIYKFAMAEAAEFGLASEWAAFHWKSSEILDEKEIAGARRSLDPLTFEQEYEGSFVNFEGRAYYPFLEAKHCAKLRHLYNPKAPLIFAFDFNVAPGVCAVIQELQLPWMPEGQTGTAVIGEVHIPQNSNTPAVCRKLLADWGSHEGAIRCYGDATGGSRGSAKVNGSDWDLIRTELKPHFGERLFFRVPSGNPQERPRVNAVNTRLLNGSDQIFLMVDPFHAPNVVKDLEGVRLLKGGSGELDKKVDPKLTHMCFAGDTLVETPGGTVVRIDALPESGLVRGFDGLFVPYSDAGLTGKNRRVVSVEFDDAQTIVCTPEHQFFTDAGWVNAIELEGRTCYDWLCVGESLAALSKSSMASLITSMGDTSYATGRECIVSSGKPTTGQSPLEHTSTTWTTIAQIMRRITWVSGHQESTRKSTWPTPNERPSLSHLCWNMLSRQRPNGTGAMLGENGTASIMPPTEPSFTRSTRTSVPNAGQSFSLRASRSHAASVREGAKPHTAETAASITRRALAQLVAISSSSGNTSLPNTARGRVRSVQDAGRRDTYCLRVPTDGCFALANGMLVSNSDGAGYYVVYEFPVIKRTATVTSLIA